MSSLSNGIVVCCQNYRFDEVEIGIPGGRNHEFGVRVCDFTYILKDVQHLKFML